MNYKPNNFSAPVFLATLLMFGMLSCNDTPGDNKQDSGGSDSIAEQPAAPAPSPSADEVREFLMHACVADLHKQQPDAKFEFRNAGVGYKTDTDGKPFYVLCGEFRSQTGNTWSGWTPFATVKTADYEQWQGDAAAKYCNDTALIRTMIDIAPGLQLKMDSLQQK